MNNYVTVNKTLFSEAEQWARLHCPGFTHADFHMNGYNLWDTGRYDFFFEESDQGRQDQTAFALKWKT